MINKMVNKLNGRRECKEGITLVLNYREAVSCICYVSAILMTTEKLGYLYCIKHAFSFSASLNVPGPRAVSVLSALHRMLRRLLSTVLPHRVFFHKGYPFHQYHREGNKALLPHKDRRVYILQGPATYEA
jgi:hypothetical protein